MGILNLHHLLEPHAEPCGLRSLLGKRVAIDLSSWIVPFMCVAQRWTPYKSRRSAGTAAAPPPPQTPLRPQPRQRQRGRRGWAATVGIASLSCSSLSPCASPRRVSCQFSCSTAAARGATVSGSKKKRGGGGKSSADTAFFAACEAAMRFLDAMGMAWIYARPRRRGRKSVRRTRASRCSQRRRE